MDSGSGYTQVDWSFLSNEALWDQYYFSSIAPRADLGEDDVSNLLERYLAGEAMPNSRIFFDLPSIGGNADAVIDTLINGASIRADAYTELAQYLLLNGAFNVNSTSVTAWEAVLSSTNQASVEYITGGSSSATASDQSSPYSRLSLPAGDSNYDWRGFRQLDTDEVHDLAAAIVDQVKLRGPFVSLSDFVNRRLVDDETGLLGALQAAIDTTDINRNITSSEITTSDLSGSNLSYPEHGIGPIEAGATGYLRQSDLLMTLGPVLSARSDAFKIRTYGDSVDPLSGERVRAWCEVVVQRVNEFVDPQDSPTTELSSLNTVNTRFGRRFEVVSFRWLDADEI